MEPISISSVLSTLGSVITTGYQIYTYISAVKNAPKSARALETEIAALDLALKKVRHFLEKNETKDRISFDSTSVLFRSVNGCKEELDALLNQLNHFRSPHRFSRLFHRLTWYLSEEDTVKAAETLHRYAQIFQLSLSTDSYAFLSVSCNTALDRLEKLQLSNDAITTDLIAVRELLLAFGDDLVDRRYKEFVEWFPTIDYESKHQNIETQRLEGSGKWLLESPAFRLWKDFSSSNSTLFCQGGPGVGKSFMSSIVADHLIELAWQTKAHVAYFYFDYKSQETQKPYSVVSCLLKQVLSQFTTRPKQADALWGLFDRKERPGLPSWQMLVDEFCHICSETRIYVVLDALDECDAAENRRPILAFIEKMRQKNVRLFATSRPFPQDILDAFEGAVPIDMEASNTDLRSYVLDMIEKSGKNKRIMTKKLRERIVASIVDNSQGMFLLAAFQISYVLAQHSRGEMEESLKVLPKGLWANFDVTMNRINSLPYEHQVSFAKQTLLWITTAARPLKVDELRHAMRIAESPLDFKLSAIPEAQLVVEYCFGFVVIDSKSDTVRLAHFSIDEYLRQKQFPFITSGHRTVSLACVNYMLLPWVPGALQDLEEDSDLDGVSKQESEIAEVSSNHNNTTTPPRQAVPGRSFQPEGAGSSSSNSLEALHGFTGWQSELMANNSITGSSIHARPGTSLHDSGSDLSISAIEALLQSLPSRGPDAFTEGQSEAPAKDDNTEPPLHPGPEKSIQDSNSDSSNSTAEVFLKSLTNRGSGGIQERQSVISAGNSDASPSLDPLRLVESYGDFLGASSPVPNEESLENLPLSLANLLTRRQNLTSTAVLEAVFKKLPFMNYAASYWGYHAAKDFSGVVADMINCWLLNDESFRFWSWIDEREARASLYDGGLSWGLFPNRRSKGPQNLNRCHVAARFGLWQLMPGSQDTKELQDQVNSRTVNGDTPLMIAAERGHVDFVNRLLANPAVNINDIDVDGHTALCRAVNARQMDAVQRLLEDPNINVTLGTPLHIALEREQTEIANTLLDRQDLDINAFREYLAIRNTMMGASLNLGLLKRILKRDDIIPRFFRQPYPLMRNMFAILDEDSDIMTSQELSDYPQIVKALAEDFWKRGQRSKRDRCLSWLWDWFSSADGELGPHFKFYLQWLEEGWDRQMADEFDDTILHDTARRSEAVDHLDQLLKHGFSADLRSADGRTALQMAAKSGSVESLRLLLASGADISAQEEQGWTALHYAAAYGRTEMVDILLETGADINAQTKIGNSAMQIAAWNDQAGIVRHLFEHGASSIIRGNKGETLLYCAVGSEETVKLALELNGNSDINLFTTTGISPLAGACLEQKPGVVRILVKNGADVNARSSTGYTALHAAVSRDNKEIVRFLLHHGANPNSEDIFFGTPYTIAVENMSETRARLLRYGGDISIESAYGRTPDTIFDSLGTLRAELGEAAELPSPVSLADIRMRQIRRLKAIIMKALENHRNNMTEMWTFTTIGHLLRYLGNFHDSRIAFEQTVSWEDTSNSATHSGRVTCRTCNSDSGSLFICTSCPRAMVCLGCFSRHPAFRRVLFEQLSADDIFASGGKDKQWACFLDINGFMDLRYKLFRRQDGNDVATLEGRQERILELLREKLGDGEPGAARIKKEFSYCHKEHKFLCVPDWEWLNLSPGTVNTRGQAVEEWLQELDESY